MGTVERAFELARAGDCSTIEEIRARLKREGFSNVDAYLTGSLLKDLRMAIRSLRSA